MFRLRSLYTKRVLQALYFLSFGLVASCPVLRAGGKYEFVDDAFYYLDRAREITTGNWLVGNPYFFEHRLDIGPSFFIPDWLTALPGSFIIFPILTALLIFYFLRQLGVGGKLLYFGVWFCFLSVFNFIVRPTSLSTIYPFFLLFLIAVKSGRIWAIVLSTAATFYIYPYLWQLTVLVLAIRVFFNRATFDRSFFWIPLLAGPALYYLFLQIQSPYYWETMKRVGLVFSHLPTVSAFYYFALLTLVLMFLLKNKFFLVIYLAFSILLFSNVLTGRELETANHVGRFSLLFGSIAVTYLLSQSRWFLILAVMWLLLILSNFSSLYQPNYSATGYKTVKTVKHYVLFHPNGALHLVPSDEILERYLVSKYPEKLTTDTLIKEFRLYSGTGPAIHLIGQHNYRVRICRLFSVFTCGEIKDVRSYYGEDYFEKILRRYYVEVFPNVQQYYRRYQVSFADVFPR